MQTVFHFKLKIGVRMRQNRFAVLLATTVFSASLVMADAINITQYDGEGSGTGWYGVQEDQEVSNSCITGQQWDLEAFILNGSKLSLVGGYNFQNGEKDPYYPNYQPRLETYYSGDIFIDVNGDAKYGSSLSSTINGQNQVIDNTFGWDYVLDLDMTKLTYEVVAIDAASKVSSAFFNINSDANPWQYVSGGSVVTSGTIAYTTGLTDAQAGFGGGSHNMMTVDLGFLTDNSAITTHYTMQCGNDNIIGKGKVSVPEPGIVLLLSMGIMLCISSGVLSRRRKI
jgi:hypothetical protein